LKTGIAIDASFAVGPEAICANLRFAGFVLEN